jgi:hypothetical protein
MKRMEEDASTPPRRGVAARRNLASTSEVN